MRAEETSALQRFPFLGELDFPSPPCEGKVDLSVAADYFVEVANEVPGVREYNDLVRFYRRKEWVAFDRAWKSFQSQFAGSPLREASVFLYAQSRVDRVTVFNDERARDVEKVLREAKLLYPKSKLAPVVTAGVAAFLLKGGASQKSLALYQSAALEYPHSTLACVFQTGIGETSYHLRDNVTTAEAMSRVMRDCKNPRLRAVAQVRLAENEVALEKALEAHDTMLARYMPWANFHLGEMKFRQRQWLPAKFYFDEYVRQAGKNATCTPFALKRLADVALQSGKKWEEVTGLYLLVRDRAPLSDVGRHSYVRALLINLAHSPKSDFRRRLKVADDEIDKIPDEKIRALAYVEKGLFLLEAGEGQALDYLTRLKRQGLFENRKVADYVRERWLQLLQSSPDRPTLRLERAFADWYRDSNFEKAASRLYAKWAIERFAERMKANDIVEAMRGLEHWETTSPWNPSVLDWDMRRQVGERIVSSILQTPSEVESPALFYLSREGVLRPFLEPEYRMAWVAIALETGDTRKIASLMLTSDRQIAEEVKVPPEEQQKFTLLAGLAYLRLENYDEAERKLVTVTAPALFDRASRARYQLYVAKRDFKKALLSTRDWIPKLPERDRREALTTLSELALSSKSWKDAPELLAVATRGGERDLAVYRFLAGRSLYEQGLYRQAIEHYELGLQEQERDTPLTREAKYRLAKCLLALDKPNDAKRLWEELARVPDNFWGPLAKSEIHLLEVTP